MSSTKKIFKCCSNCRWSERNIKNLEIICTLGLKIENTWKTAKKCKEWSFASSLNKPIQLKLKFK